MENGNELHTLIPMADFKKIFGIDDRDDALCRLCLITSTYTIEQYCKRHLLKKKCVEYLEFTGDYLFPLREYPVREILGVYRLQISGVRRQEMGIVEPDFYHTIPDCGDLEDVPFLPLGFSGDENGPGHINVSRALLDGL
jgi:hypothetical protein